jgi:hypothetical protein
MDARQRPPCVGLRIALRIVIKFLGGGGHVQQALVSLSIGNGPLYPEDKLTHTGYEPFLRFLHVGGRIQIQGPPRLWLGSGVPAIPNNLLEGGGINITPFAHLKNDKNCPARMSQWLTVYILCQIPVPGYGGIRENGVHKMGFDPRLPTPGCVENFLFRLIDALPPTKR